MILPAVSVLLLLALASALFARRLLSALLVLPALALLVLAGTRPVPQIVLDGLRAPYVDQSAPEWAASNAIILLGADVVVTDGRERPGLIAYGRIAGAAEAYRSCKSAQRSCKIVASGGDPRVAGVAEADIYAAALADLGVPSSDILTETRSRNTFENARYTGELVKNTPFDRYFLVTSAFHMRRSLLYFGHFGIDARPMAVFVLQPVRSRLPLAYNTALADIALHEYIGIARYDLYNLMGWNPPPAQNT
ncbi:YdcF family protein [Nitratireductor sp. XY-223]|uniref:YdcF family protein n=1 Tax=Nitratireductor sp. XY-223 TaxID=2561926 RepID=UPI0010A9E61C|nr:YdcF family protein [Nitratireductor sp. XY-223]